MIQRINVRKEYGVLLIMVLTGCAIIYHPYISGESIYAFWSEGNDDTFQSYIPMYQAVVEKIRDADFSLMDFNWCTGANLLDAQFVIFDPFAIPMYFAAIVLGPTAVPKLLVWVQILRVVCAAIACDYFLNCYELNKKARILTSVCYAFSSYMVGSIGQHYMFATAPVVFALMLAFLEKSTNQPEYRVAFTLCVAVAGIWSVYFTYMMLLSCGIYAVIRFLWNTNRFSWKGVIDWFGPLLICVIIGLLLASAVFLPTAYSLLFSSDRMSARASLRQMISVKEAEHLKTIFLRFFSDHSEGTLNHWSGYDHHFNAPHIYFSGMLIVAIPQYASSITKMEKRKKYICLAIFTGGIAAFSFPAVGIIYNAFTYHMGRYVFVFLPAFAFVVAKVITDAENQHYFSKVGAITTVGATVLAIALCNWSFLGENLENVKNQAFNFLAVFVGLMCLYMLSCEQTYKKKQIITLGFSLIFAATISESWCGLNIKRSNVLCENIDVLYDNNGVRWIQDLREENKDLFYRTERVLTGWGSWPMFSSSLAFEYCGVSGYNSVLNADMVDFCRTFGKAGDYQIRVAYAYGELGCPGDWCMADLLGIRYILSNYPINEPEWDLVYESYDYGTELMYENPRIHTMGTVYYGWYPEEKVSENTLENQMMLPFAVSLDHAAENVPQVDQPEVRCEQIVSDHIVVSAGSTIENSVELPLDSFEHQENERTWLSFRVNGTVGTNLVCAVDTGFGFSSVNWSNGTYYLNEEEMTVYLALPNDIQKVGFYVDGASREDVLISDLVQITTTGKSYTTEGIEFHSPQQSGEIYGTVQMDRPGILVLPVFIQDGWHLEVNGEEQGIWTANTALCATELSEGTHSIRLWYDVPWGREGLITSIVGVIGLLGMAYVVKRRQK